MKKQLLLYLARAHYLSSNLIECELILKKLIHFEPENLEFQYNLALTKEFSINILQKQKNEALKSSSTSFKQFKNSK